jgi:RNA polymerase sigma-70 factor (ECF subfamily)
VEVGAIRRNVTVDLAQVGDSQVTCRFGHPSFPWAYDTPHSRLAESRGEKSLRDLSRFGQRREVIKGMGLLMENNSAETVRLVELARTGDANALNAIFARHRERLRRMVELRLDRRLAGRVDASDVVQDGFVDAVTRLPDFLADPKLPLFLWLRLVVGERLSKVHRTHLGAQMRDAGLEVSLYRDALPAASSAALAAQLLGKQTSPVDAAVRAEQMIRVQEAINALDPIDREIIALRNFEELSRAEAARVLGIEEPAAAKRYVRALRRLRPALGALAGEE